MLPTKSVKLNLNEQAADDLDTIAKELGLTKTEVLRKGLLVMGLYAELKKNKKGALVLRNDEDKTERQLVLV